MTTTTETAAALRASAAAADAEAAASFERCDTDGFLSQWASGINARKDRMQAEIVENGGRYEHSALFTVDGELVAAKLVDTKFGLSWMLLENDDPRSRCAGWFNSSKANNDERRIATNARKGYRLGRVMAPAVAEIGGGGRGLAGAASCYVYARRTDGGFSRDVEVVSIEGLLGEPTDQWNN